MQQGLVPSAAQKSVKVGRMNAQRIVLRQACEFIWAGGEVPVSALIPYSFTTVGIKRSPAPRRQQKRLMKPSEPTHDRDCRTVAPFKATRIQIFQHEQRLAWNLVARSKQARHTRNARI
eukprot:CAMPEP_0180573450 /NCGR_PEP_ID=MMETSP1037_2-20121125/9773_1 /TAXON_ID=632150 /ORGANISM="Azadinium spinosum, Strain 3D9" /LENGTH=118 /DNA_ID=CAMNT_0022590863 /DNA_START=400 /DNA_END=756 /DNA_ORIENTATION=+